MPAACPNMLSRMRPRRLIATLATAAALAGAVPAAVHAQALGGVGAAMVCVAPHDAADLDAMLQRAGSPLAGEGATFVREGTRVGVDPRALVAIAAHETMLETYGPAQLIRNPFGLGPGWSFDTHADAIARAASTLQSLYLPEGRVGIPEIGSKWAPVGAANDPGSLNQHWAGGVGTFYRALGGDPGKPILLSEQADTPDCAPSPADAGGLSTVAADDAPAATDSPEATGPPVVTAWGGVTPTSDATGPAGGIDPATGRPAVIEGFVFPLALPRGAAADYADTFALPGPVPCVDGARLQCALTIASAPGTTAVAMAGGVLHPATVDEREEGIALWVVTPSGDRVGYGALVDYAAGVAPGVHVAPGQGLGTAPARLRVAWEHSGVRTNPFPLLSATRAPTG